MIELTMSLREALNPMTESMDEMARRAAMRLFYELFPDEDKPTPKWATDLIDNDVIFARHKYPKHLAFFKAGATYPERLLRAANRIGKTLAGSYETTCHLTGRYPDWWEGRRFKRPVRAWAAGKTSETTRDILQTNLLGTPIVHGGHKGFSGTGVIPGNLIGGATWKSGIQDLADTVRIQHISGGWSRLGFKSYNQGRDSFEGTAQHVIMLDEEPPMDVYGECLIRTATTNGLIMLTFTPLEGMSEVVLEFLPADERPPSAGDD